MGHSADDLSATIEKLHATLNQLYAIDSSWRDAGGWPDEVTGSILHAGASREAIAQAESRFGQSFPPSYQQFLQLHGAWEHFWGDFTLIGVGSANTRAAQEKIAEYTQEQQDYLRGKLGDGFSAADAKNWEGQAERNLFLAHHLPIGTNFSGELWVFDTRTRRTDGEMTLVFWDISYGAQEPQFPNFFDFLDWALLEAQSRLSDS